VGRFFIFLVENFRRRSVRVLKLHRGFILTKKRRYYPPNIFQLNHNCSLGGRLLSAVYVGLNPVLVAAGDDEIELLVVQVKLGHLNVRIFNAYGPQEDDTAACKLFWQGLEKEIIRAKQENCCIIIEMDANPKLERGTTNMSANGQVNSLIPLKRKNLLILKLPSSEGVSTDQ
jgi:hypothetical protein